MGAEAIVFWVFAVIGVGAALAMIMMRNIVHAALMLVLNLLAISALYLALQSSFLAIIQIIVYAGAIMVLFLFVIMLLGVARDDLLFDTRPWHRAAVGVGGLVIAGMLVFGVAGEYLGDAARCGGQADPEAVAASTTAPCVGLDAALEQNEHGSVGIIAERLFTRWTFPFEISALLLVVATIGALILGRRNDPEVAAAARPDGPEPEPAPMDGADDVPADADSSAGSSPTLPDSSAGSSSTLPDSSAGSSSTLPDPGPEAS